MYLAMVLMRFITGLHASSLSYRDESSAGW